MDGSKGTVCILGSSDADGARWTAELATHLAPLRRTGSIVLWHEGESLAGDEIGSHTGVRLAAADLVIALLTPRALADREMVQRAETVHRRGARLWPVIVRACDWEYPPFAGLAALPEGHVPVFQFRDRGKAWNEVAAAIRKFASRRG